MVDWEELFLGFGFCVLGFGFGQFSLADFLGATFYIKFSFLGFGFVTVSLWHMVDFLFKSDFETQTQNTSGFGFELQPYQLSGFWVLLLGRRLLPKWGWVFGFQNLWIQKENPPCVTIKLFTWKKNHAKSHWLTDSKILWVSGFGFQNSWVWKRNFTRGKSVLAFYCEKH